MGLFGQLNIGYFDWQIFNHQLMVIQGGSKKPDLFERWQLCGG